MDARQNDEKQRVSWTHALRQIVTNCYEFHGREDLLPKFSEEDGLAAGEGRQNQVWSLTQFISSMVWHFYWTFFWRWRIMDLAENLGFFTFSIEFWQNSWAFRTLCPIFWTNNVEICIKIFRKFDRFLSYWKMNLEVFFALSFYANIQKKHRRGG